MKNNHKYECLIKNKIQGELMNLLGRSIKQEALKNSENQQNPKLNKAKSKEQLTQDATWNLKKAIETYESVNTSHS
jgi:hypothetical protein